MEQLGILEKKLALLIENKKVDAKQIEELSFQNECLNEEMTSLKGQLETSRAELEALRKEGGALREQMEKLENSLLVGRENIDVLNQERELAKIAVDDLIKSIESVINEQESLQ